MANLYELISHSGAFGCSVINRDLFWRKYHKGPQSTKIAQTNAQQRLNPTLPLQQPVTLATVSETMSIQSSRTVYIPGPNLSSIAQLRDCYKSSLQRKIVQ